MVGVQDVLRRQGKSEFYEYIKIALPATQDNHNKFRKALIETLQELNNLNIRSAMNSGADWLGAFYEVFLRYANWAQDLGIVLTPRQLTRWVADVMDVQTNDIIYDPTCGTGGFLVAAFDTVKRRANETQLNRFKQNSLFGVEQDSGVAALAVVNMIFRGDGKNNIIEGNCFAKHLDATNHDGAPTALYIKQPSQHPPITKVMMNPPFALKRSDEKEFKFIDQALSQMEDGGLLFSVMPYSAMVRPGAYLNWRRHSLLANNTLLAVVTFPIDVFYPVGITSVGVFIRKGIPHPPEQNILWVRALNDGLLKSKGKRLPKVGVPDDLATARDTVRAFIHNPNHSITSIHQFQRAVPLDTSDPLLELVPEAYLEQAAPMEMEITHSIAESVRSTFAYLVKIDKAIISKGLLERPARMYQQPHAWGRFMAETIFDLKRGNFHSIADLDPGEYPTISRVGTDNGLVGFFDKPEKARVWTEGIITVSTVTGDAFIQPVPFIATDNVVLCAPKAEYSHIRLTSLCFITAMLNTVKWRYSYGRQCYKTKFARTEFLLPVDKGGG